MQFASVHLLRTKWVCFFH